MLAGDGVGAEHVAGSRPSDWLIRMPSQGAKQIHLDSLAKCAI